jgi:uncharacterized damage-inducible protein DinB
MDLLDRLLGHDAWTTRLLLERCAELDEAQLDREFDVDGRSVRAVLRHMIGNVEVWTSLMRGETTAEHRPGGVSLTDLVRRHDAVSQAFAALALQVRDDRRLNELWVDAIDNPPRQKSYATAILHVVSHNMHHRAQLLLMLGWLGLRDLPEGDLFSWESANT